jgi:Holliday junction resolvasome RuvABC endonuclease subunit
LPLFSLALLVGRYIKKYNPKIIAIEHPIFYKGHVQGAMRTIYFHALLRGVIYQDHAKSILYEYWPKSWKKKFTGTGNSSKGLVMWIALRDYGWKFFNPDQSDAFGIMQAALSDYRSTTANKANEPRKKARSGNSRQRALINKGRSR